MLYYEAKNNPQIKILKIVWLKKKHLVDHWLHKISGKKLED